jgi:hypothetical protein
MLGVTALLLFGLGWGTAAHAGSTSAVTDHQPRAARPDAAERIDPVEFRQDMRKLWEDHVTWTRLFIVSAIAGLPDIQPTAARLLQNQSDIGAAIAPFYGDAAGAALTDLLRDHILIAADLVTAAKAGDDAAVAASRQRWYANARTIADFLAGANPAWSRRELRDMMREHLDQTLAEATARLQGDWAADIAEYERIHVHILHMSDVLAAGIIEQFPRHFGS